MLERARGLHYLEVLAALHKALEPQLYLEIGTQKGRSLKPCKSRAIAIDPEFKLEPGVIGSQAEVTLIQDTSDAFFDNGAAARLIDRPVDMAFLDGMHLFEYLLRDFINTECYAAPGAMVMLHDCLPWTANMAARDRSTVVTQAWTGDVWKVAEILDRYRPDLELTILDAAPTGLVAITGLNPDSTVLADQYDAIVAEYMAREIDEATPPAIMQPARRKSAHEFAPVARVRPMVPAAAATRSLKIAIKTPVPRPKLAEKWGDHHFAIGLQSALLRLGHEVRIDSRKSWERAAVPGEIDIVVRGKAPYAPSPERPAVAWIISNSAAVTQAELAPYAHCLAAGDPLVTRLKADGAKSVALLPQAFDADRMYPPSETAPRRSGVFFAGIARPQFSRLAVEYAVETDQPLSLFGAGWGDTSAAPFVKGDRIDNAELGNCYRRAEVVLNDHSPDMRAAGIPSNRIFDALACGAPVVTDAVSWLPEDLKPWVYVFHDKHSFAAAVANAQSETAEKREARLAFALEMKANHSFDARAVSLTAMLAEIAQTPHHALT